MGYIGISISSGSRPQPVSLYENPRLLQAGAEVFVYSVFMSVLDNLQFDSFDSTFFL
jgi:hypothetical protein